MEQDGKTDWARLTPIHEVKRDAYGWTLRTWTDGTANKDTDAVKKGDPIRVHRDSYHGTLGQACSRIVDQEAGLAPDVDSIVKAIDRARREITRALNGMAVSLH